MLTRQLPLKTAQFYAIPRKCEGVQAIKHQQLTIIATPQNSQTSVGFYYSQIRNHKKH